MEYVEFHGPASVVLASTRIFRDLTRINGGRSRSGVDGGESYDRLLVHVYVASFVALL